MGGRKRLYAAAMTIAVMLSGCAGFKDVSEEAWYARAVKYVSERGIMSGTDKRIFDPDKPITRAMMVTVLYREAGEPEPGESSRTALFEDVPGESWCADAVYWAKQLGIITGVDETHFMPNMPVNREQTALILWRAAGKPGASGFASCGDRLKVSPYAIPAVNWAWERGVMKGNADNLFEPFAFTTRAQFAQILYNINVG